MANSQSTVTLQNILDICQAFGDTMPTLNAGGSGNQPFLICCIDVMNAICAVDFPHKWNELIFPPFYTNSLQQDYAVVNPDGTSITNLSWLQRANAIDINNTSQPKPWRYVECGRQLAQQTGTWYNFGNSDPLFTVNWFPNSMLYYGVWGDMNTGNSTFGNNPGPGSIYINPVGGGFGTPTSMPANPITQIIDANGNLLLLTTYGTEGSDAPVASPNAAPGTTTAGTGATTVWTVVDPQGCGFRILPVPSTTGTVWQINVVGQMKPVRFTSLGQTLYPLTDEYESHFRMGVIAQLYRYSPLKEIRAKFEEAWKLWIMSLNDMRARQDRELEENEFTLTRTIFGGTRRGQSAYPGAAYPFAY